MSKYHTLVYEPCTMEEAIAGTIGEIEHLIFSLECEVDYLNQSVFKDTNEEE